MPIACGNTAVLKPSTESSAAGGVVLAEVFQEAGFPKGVLNLVTNGPGKSGEIGDEFTPTLQKPEGFRVKATEGDVVVFYFEPSATQNLKSSGFPEG
jgi:aldehyde dehydrogenase (NAD+)